MGSVRRIFVPAIEREGVFQEHADYLRGAESRCEPEWVRRGVYREYQSMVRRDAGYQRAFREAGDLGREDPGADVHVHVWAAVHVSRPTRVDAVCPRAAGGRKNGCE